MVVSEPNEISMVLIRSWIEKNLTTEVSHSHIDTYTDGGYVWKQ
jgi:hypothetical protein